MPNKQYKTENNSAQYVVSEPAVAYRTKTTEAASTSNWNPNVPFCGTQEEWWEHFHQIEEGNFSTWEEHQKKFNIWKKAYLENRVK